MPLPVCVDTLHLMQVKWCAMLAGTGVSWPLKFSSSVHRFAFYFSKVLYEQSGIMHNMALEIVP